MDPMPGTHRFLFASVVLTSFVMLPQSSAGAQGGLAAQAASQIVEGCVAHARAKGQSHAVAVYDDGGHLVAYLRMDGNSPGVGAFAMQKGAAGAHWRFSTAAMANSVKETPGFANAPHVVTVAGGIPVFSRDGKQFLGAVGVSGEAAHDDAACAEAGVKAAGLSPSRISR
ncbi:MAG TPA: heme-binding protein [Gemmatimonadaceae bacterium]|nr:heme-binding protein [Gemmatimonadaceae bacterium]